jgi:hypothetical protein
MDRQGGIAQGESPELAPANMAETSRWIRATEPTQNDYNPSFRRLATIAM